jgi:hypothetical protein
MPEDDGQLAEVRHAYRVLGVSTDAEAVSIKRAYRHLLMRWHPDHYTSGTPDHVEATQMARLINEAYEVVEHAPLRNYVATNTVTQREKLPDNLYEQEWKLYAAWRTKILILIALAFVSYVPLALCLVPIHRKFFDLIGAPAYVLLLSLTIRQVGRCRCPRCHNNFFGALWKRRPELNYYRQSCAYCDLPKGA